MISSGLEILVSEEPQRLKNRRVGLVSHAAAVLPDLTGAVEALLRAGIQVKAIFGPEHGFGGGAADGAQVGHGQDARTGIPVFSLYGDTKEPTAEMLDSIDVLVYDMQDVGVRFYTYLSTLYYVLRGAGKANKPVMILDRPNPITGTIVEGPGIEAGYTSFVGIIDIPIRHGMTLGELALYMNSESKLGAEMEVLPMRGWQRSQWFDQTGLLWTPTSPAMPHLSTAIVYPGMCLLEGTDLSLGRGTALPFEICGAPWIDGTQLAGQMNHLGLAGVRFRPIDFIPSASNYQNQNCAGVQVHVTDRQAFRPLETALELINQIRRLYPAQFEWHAAHFDRLTGSPSIRQQLADGETVSEISAGWKPYTSEFEIKRNPFLLYS